MEENYRRVKFTDIFNELPDGSLTPKVSIEINGAGFAPGVVFSKGVIFGGVDFHLYKYRDIAIENSSDSTEFTDSSEVLKIVGFYKE